jgi:hypothetical protein
MGQPAQRIPDALIGRRKRTKMQFPSGEDFSGFATEIPGIA